jgi:hypothetical protein
MTPNKIILHHSGGPDGEGNTTAAIRRYHIETLGWQDVGYHALAENIGGSFEIVMGRPWDMNGAHTIGQNDRALGLCIVGHWNMEPPPDGQLAVAAKWVAFWCRHYQIPTHEIYRHSFWSDTDCPGHQFDLEQFQAMVGELI